MGVQAALAREPHGGECFWGLGWGWSTQTSNSAPSSAPARGLDEKNAAPNPVTEDLFQGEHVEARLRGAGAERLRGAGAELLQLRCSGECVWFFSSSFFLIPLTWAGGCKLFICFFFFKDVIYLFD